VALLCGAATVDITPEVGGQMDGYGYRRAGSQGIADRLKASVVVFEATRSAGASGGAGGGGGQRVAIVAADVIGFPESLAGPTRDRIAAALGVVRERVMLTATHTHAGPAAGILKDRPVDDRYWEGVRERIAGAARRAVQALQPVVIAAGTGSVAFPVNRRDAVRRAAGTPTPGPVDRSVRLLAAVGTGTGRPVAVVAHASCHPVTLGPTHHLISADFPAGLYERLAGLGVPVLFVNGSAADINPNRLEGESEMERRDRCGAELARTAEAILERALEQVGGTGTPSATWRSPEHASAGDAVIHCKEISLRLPLEELPGPERLEEEIRRLEAELETANDPGRHVTERRLGWTREALRLRSAFPGPLWLDAAIQAIRVGGCAFLGLPFEVFTATGLAILEAFPAERDRIFIAGYTNGAYGYLTPRYVLEEGGYEADSAYFWYGMPNRYAPEAEEIVRTEAVRLLREIVRDVP